MFERELIQYEAQRLYALRLVEDLSDAQLAIEPAGMELNNATWVLGHLTCSADFTLGLVGAEAVSPEPWRKAFGGGSNPARLAVKPGKAELIAQYNAAHAAVAAAAERAGGDAMNQPHGFDFFKSAPLRTKADVVSFLLTTHEAGHLGQLSAWRRALKLPPVAP